MPLANSGNERGGGHAPNKGGWPRLRERFDKRFLDARIANRKHRWQLRLESDERTQAGRSRSKFIFY
jgi:hypothetical protein